MEGGDYRNYLVNLPDSQLIPGSLISLDSVRWERLSLSVIISVVSELYKKVSWKSECLKDCFFLGLHISNAKGIISSKVSLH